jgi:ribosomal 50S subunit-recycling heat shock protein
MTNSEWIVPPEEAGTRLDKFLASPARLGSRGRALGALDRGKVYVNGEESAAGDASRRLETGDAVRFWMDRPGSARRRPRIGRSGDLDVIY